MKKTNLILPTLLLAGSLLIPAQGINYTIRWIESTTGGIPWMQNFICCIQVNPDGSVYKFCGWAEGSGGARRVTYKDGNILASYSRNNNYKQITDQARKTRKIQNHPGDIYL